MNNELTDQQFEELKLLYSISASDLSFFKRQQWVITNYALILYATLITIGTKLLPDPLMCWEKIILGIVAGATWIVASIVHYHLQGAINIRRERLKKCREKFSKTFLEAWSSGEDSSDYVYKILYIVLILGFGSVLWVLFSI
ncbi:MAG: hypothetical protein A2077_00975 [Nitrospirae bacterium GWC2_46_6]|nr:MAG: hypothetical protein A2077_00975 [Nitrospirae bacterium GWC2_46_6]OGW21444.1 MAG: hypothetical protein A2Z82_06465 [Nitrospirae bacterium GWA2_46_11]OGW24843.1 MAG: hypothetical protein A2X55_08105 [Nitrospirae bacterium GWB2_47_37]HAK88170.1 hypothetical protein [Nitrospiraceae bacterium]HCL81080.1 hypothetical protein [Nitrospiraceae bacterium]